MGRQGPQGFDFRLIDDGLRKLCIRRLHNRSARWERKYVSACCPLTALIGLQKVVLWYIFNVEGNRGRTEQRLSTVSGTRQSDKRQDNR
jgi:hypothetical protein